MRLVSDSSGSTRRRLQAATGEDARVLGIAAGTVHSCTVLASGDMLCFGRGSTGQLGSDSSARIGDDPACPTARGIVKLPPGARAVAAAAGNGHTCVVLDDGRALCFGGGSYGRLGSDATDNIGDSPSRPTASGIVKLPQGTRAVAISAGDFHTCAVLDDGRALCFGDGASGRIGSDAFVY